MGLAAIQLGRAMGAEIFATAGSDAKRDVVRLLGADHVLDSRSLAFADDVLALTDGQGVDVVLNSLAGEAINRNLRILRPFGRFLGWANVTSTKTRALDCGRSQQHFVFRYRCRPADGGAAALAPGVCSVNSWACSRTGPSSPCRTGPFPPHRRSSFAICSSRGRSARSCSASTTASGRSNLTCQRHAG
ncbi:MAG: zinc-binding dehydrogenase [Chromatiales bacterium]|nr:zinc-binding dehydrogenase [Chromatiales bacterium]